MRNMGLTGRMAIAIGTVAIVLVAAVAVLTFAIRELNTSAREARVAEQTVATAERVRSLVVDAETGIRGFALTDRDVFLEPLLSAETNLPEATAALTGADLPNARARALATAIAANTRDYVNEYATPLVETIRLNSDEGRNVILAGTGKRRVDQIREELNELSGIIRRHASRTAADATDRADTARALSIGAAILAIALFSALLAYLARTVVAPIRRTADAATELGAGDLGVRLDVTSKGEIGELARAFNAMGDSLARNADELDAQQTELEHQNAELEQQAVELESQAVELEAQTAELESGQVELADVNASLMRRSRELERTAEELRAAHARTSLFADVADALGRVAGLTARAEVLLSNAADMLGAEIGTVYARGDDAETAVLVATRGLPPRSMPTTLDGIGGLAGRSYAEQRTLLGDHDDGELPIVAFGTAVNVRRELHVPLRHGEQVVGVLSLARSGEAPLDPEDVAAVEHLAEQAAVAFENAVQSARRQWLADLQQAVLDATGDAIRMLTADGEILINNPEMVRFERDVFQIEPMRSAADLPRIGQLIGDRTSDPEGYRARLQAILADPEGEFVDEYELVDTHRWIHRYTAPVRASDGSVAGRIFVLREVTEQRRASALKDELMSTVSHELRTPLSAILGFSELLKARDYEKPERDEYLDTIHQQATRLSRLISDFLDITRLEQAEEALHIRKVELRSLLQQQVDLFGGQSTEHPVRLDAPDDLVVDCDEEHVRRAISNLISNAIKYSPEGGEVRVEAVRRNGDVVVAVRDHGIGIPADDQRRVFDRFYRVDNTKTRRIGGTGLGLALVREIARAHGGEVGVESVEGQGSRFWLKMPAEHHEDHADHAAA